MVMPHADTTGRLHFFKNVLSSSFAEKNLKYCLFLSLIQSTDRLSLPVHSLPVPLLPYVLAPQILEQYHAQCRQQRPELLMPAMRA